MIAIKLKRGLTLLIALFAIENVCAADRAKDDSAASIAFGTFPLPLKRTYVSSEAGTPATKAKLNDPFPNDYPPCITVMLEDIRKFPESKEPRYYFPSRNVLRVYRISQVNTAPYKTIQADIKSLRKLLKERPTAVPEYSEDEKHYLQLPDYPPRNSAHAFQVKLSYLDAAWGSALCYVTQFTQDGGTPANNEELTYIVQGTAKTISSMSRRISASRIQSCPIESRTRRVGRRATTGLIVLCYPNWPTRLLRRRSTKSGRG
ncbi:MAG: hypothetical protein ACREFF_06040 [Candidatus Udaeobacter sp.]